MPKNNYFGLSLTERLNKAGTNKAFLQAIKSSDAETMTKLLLQIDYSASSTKATVNTFLENPNALPE